MTAHDVPTCVRRPCTDIPFPFESWNKELRPLRSYNRLLARLTCRRLVATTCYVRLGMYVLLCGSYVLEVSSQQQTSQPRHPLRSSPWAEKQKCSTSFPNINTLAEKIEGNEKSASSSISALPDTAAALSGSDTGPSDIAGTGDSSRT